MKSAMNKVFWGFIIVFLNINIGIIQLLPDFIGYIIIAIGLAKLGKIEKEMVTREFYIAKNLAYAMVVMSVISFFLANPNLNYTGVGITIFGAVSTVFFYSLYYFILKGINELAIVLQCDDLECTSRTLGNSMLIIGVIYLCFNSFTLNFSQRGAMIAIAPILVVVVLGVFIYFLYFIRKVYLILE